MRIAVLFHQCMLCWICTYSEFTCCECFDGGWEQQRCGYRAVLHHCKQRDMLSYGSEERKEEEGKRVNGSTITFDSEVME